MIRARILACGRARATAGNVSDFNAGRTPASHPANPPALNQRRLMAKTKTIRIANQKFGTAMPSCVIPMTPASTTVPRRDAAQIPAGNPMRMLNARA